MVKIAAALFEPDKSRYNVSASQEILNAIPVADGWAPQPSGTLQTPAVEYLTDASGNRLTDGSGNYLVTGPGGSVLSGEVALASDTKGCFFARTATGSTAMFIGTTTKLYRFNFTDNTFNDVSGASAPYTVPVTGRWSFTQFGDVVYAQNGFDPEQKFNVVSDTVFSDNTTAPIVSYLITANDFVHRLRYADDPSKQQWSGLNDPTQNTIGERLSDVQVQPVGNGITGGVPMSFGAMVFCRDAIFRQVYNPGSQWVYQFAIHTQKRGAIAPYSIASVGQDDFVFYAADGFFRGVEMRPIGAQRVDKWLIDNTTEAARTAMTATPDYERKIVWFRFEISTTGYMLLGYNWQLDRWCLSDIGFIDMFPAETPSITIDGLDNLYPTIDAIDVPFDSPLFDGGATAFAGITEAGYLAYMAGAPLQATLTTNEVSLNGTDRAFVNRLVLDSDAINGTVTPITTDYKGGTPRERSASTPSSRSRSFAMRADGMTHKFRVIFPAGEDWTIFSGVDVEAARTGRS